MKIDIHTFYYVSNHCAKSHGEIHSFARAFVVHLVDFHECAPWV